MSLDNKRSITYEYIITFFIVFLSLCYRIEIINKRNLCILAFLLLAIDMLGKMSKGIRINVYATDLLWVAHLLIFIFHRDRNYPLQYTMFFLLGWIAMFILRDYENNFRSVLNGLLFFAAINLVVNIITVLSPNSYRTLTTILFGNYYWTGNLAGLGGDGGRNAFYCIAGISVLFSAILSQTTKHKTINWVIIIVLISFVFATGKLSHSSFVVATMLLVIILAENNLSRRVRGVFVFVLIGAIVFAIVYEVFPEIQFLITRNLGKADISSGRFTLWDTAIDIFKQHPIFGIGYGAFSVNSLSITNYAVYVGVHNDYIQWLCESGVIGFTVNILITISAYSLSIKELKLVSSESSYNGSITKKIIIWSVFFQTFILLYSLTGIPHFSYEINTTLYFACAVPFGLLQKEEFRTKLSKSRRFVLAIGAK